MPRARMIVDADVRPTGGGAARGEAVAWLDGKVLAVGSRQEVERVAGVEAEVWDAAGATVLPGFVDSHHHPSIVALFGGLVRLRPPLVTDIASLKRALAAAARDVPRGEWLVATDWDEALLDERRAPTCHDLDEAAPDHHVFLMHYSCHRGVAGSSALAAAGIGKSSVDPPGGTISRDRRGRPDGLLIERGMSPVESRARASLVARDAEGFFARLERHHRALLAVGITHVVDATVPGDLATLYREAARRGSLLIPTTMFPVSTTGYLEEPWEALDGPRTGEGDHLLRVGPVKLVFDGAPGCAMCLGWWQVAGSTVRTWAMTFRQRSLDPLRTALSLAPRLGAKVRTGIAIYDRARARDVVHAAVDRGFSLACHAIGNDAVDVAVATYEAEGAALSGAGIPRLEHGTFLDRELVARIAGVGAAVVAQPHFVALPAYGSAASIPGLRNFPIRWLLDAGVRVAGSSDFPVAGFDPLDGIRGAVSRRTGKGHVLEPDQRIDLGEAIDMYTRVGAEVSGCADQCGTLDPGKRADLVVLDRRLTAASLEWVTVRATVLGGEVVHGAIQ